MRVLLHINATAYRTLGAERVEEAPDAFNPVRRFRQTFRMHPHGGQLFHGIKVGICISGLIARATAPCMAQAHHIRLSGNQQVQCPFQLLFQVFPAQVFPDHAVILRQQHVIRIKSVDRRMEGSYKTAFHRGGHRGKPMGKGRLPHLDGAFRKNGACFVKIAKQPGPAIGSQSHGQRIRGVIAQQSQADFFILKKNSHRVERFCSLRQQEVRFQAK